MKLSDLLNDYERAVTETIKYEFSDDQYLVLSDKEHCLKGQWLELYPSSSEQYQGHSLNVERKYAGKKDDFSPVQKENELIAGLIKSWSFAEEPTLENKIAALKLFNVNLKITIMSKANTVNFTRKPAKS